MWTTRSQPPIFTLCASSCLLTRVEFNNLFQKYTRIPQWIIPGYNAAIETTLIKINFPVTNFTAFPLKMDILKWTGTIFALVPMNILIVTYFVNMLK